MRLDKSIQNSAVLFVLLALLIAVVMWFNLTTIVPPRHNLFDFYPRWRGGQALWQGESPYSQAITDAIQQGMFGGTLPPEADQQRMVYPAYVGLLLAPLIALPVRIATAIWLAIQLIAVLFTPIIWLQILGWKPRLLLLAALIVGLCIVFRYPINLYIVGQFTGTILLGFSLALLLLQRQRDALAGVVLALAAMPPTIAIPLALLVMGGCALLGRFRALVAFISTLAILTAITVLQIGWWIPDFLAQLGDYSTYAFPVWAPSFIEPSLLSSLFVLAVIGLLGHAFVRLWRTRHLADFALFLPIICLLLLPQTGNYYLVLLIPPLLAIFQRGGIILRLGVAFAIVSPWLLRMLPNPSVESLLLPLYVLLLWLVTIMHTKFISR